MEILRLNWRQTWSISNKIAAKTKCGFKRLDDPTDGDRKKISSPQHDINQFSFLFPILFWLNNSNINQTRQFWISIAPYNFQREKKRKRKEREGKNYVLQSYEKNCNHFVRTQCRADWNDPKLTVFKWNKDIKKQICLRYESSLPSSRTRFSSSVSADRPPCLLSKALMVGRQQIDVSNEPSAHEFGVLCFVLQKLMKWKGAISTTRTWNLSGRDGPMRDALLGQVLAHGAL